MTTFRRQLTTLLAVWLVAFPLPPILRDAAGPRSVPTALATEQPAGPGDADRIRAVNYAVWQSLFNEPFNDATSYYWLDEVLEDGDTFVNGTTSSQKPFGFALSVGRASVPVGDHGDRLTVCAGVLTTGLADHPVMAAVATAVWPATGERRSAIMVIDTLPHDSPLFAISTLDLMVGGGNGSEIIEEFIEQRQAVDPHPVGCTSGCRHTQFVNDNLAWEVYENERAAADTALDTAMAAARARKNAAVVAAVAALNSAIATIGAGTLACMAGCFWSGPAFWACQSVCALAAVALIAIAMLACAQALQTAADTYVDDALAAVDQYEADMLLATRNRDAAFKANATIAACCILQCEGLPCPPENGTLPPMPE